MNLAAQPLAAQPLWLVILGLSLTGSFVGAVVAAVASALNDRSRKRFEKQKWRAEFYVRPQLEALRNLHAAMVHSHYEINMRASARMPQTPQEYQEQVARPEMDFFRALTIADVYLDNDTKKIMYDVLGTLRQMTTSVWLRLPEIFESHGKHKDVELREPDWQPFTKSFDAAHVRLTHLLHPDQLMKWVRK